VVDSGNISLIAKNIIQDGLVSADNSWKKSSGHAFEEMIVLHCNQALEKHGIKIYQ